MALRDTFLNMLGVSAPEVPKTDNSVFKSARDFLRYGNREKLYPDWSDVKMPDSDMYRGYSYAVIQKRSNKVATLAKNNLSTWAKPEVVDAFQDKDETVLHPYLKLIEDSTEFSEKQFWKNISIYLDLAGRYYLGVIRNQIVPSNPNLPVITTDATRFVLLNPYEIRRVIDKDKNVAGYIERKKDGRYREWPKHQIIEMRELNPFDPENSQWAMTDAAKEAVYTINQSSDYTRQSLHGNIEAPGIITTDVLLNDQDFANFRARVTQHQKGEPLFGNGTGAIKWDAMQIDLDKAALMDINEINRTTLFAVSGTSKTSLGIEQSGTTRETARVQSEQFIADTAQPRLEDIVDFLNLDYKKNYFNEYKKTGYYIEVKSAVGRDYDTEQKATALKQSQFQLAMQLMQAGYTEQSAYQFAEGEIDFDDLELEKGLDKPQNPENPSEEEGSNEDSPNSPNNGPQSGSGAGDDNNTTSEQNSLETADNDAQDKDVLTTDLNELEPHSELVENGGPGSGNHGHAGRPGEVGGSGKNSSVFDNPWDAGDNYWRPLWDAELRPGQTYSEYYRDEKDLATKVVEISPETYLEMLQKGGHSKGMTHEQLRQGNPESIEFHRQKIRDNEPITTPTLSVEPDGKTIRNQEGRHRLEAAILEGVEKVPVMVSYHPSGANIDQFLSGFDYKDITDSYKKLVTKHLEKETNNNSLEGENSLPFAHSHEGCTCEHDHKVEHFINEVQPEEGKEVKEAYDEFLTEIRALEKETINAVARKLTTNAFDESDIIGKRKKATITDKIKNAIRKYWWLLLPLFANNGMSKRNKEFGENIIFTFDNALQNKVINNADRVAKGHMDTILNDILEASNKVYTDILEGAAADLVITAYRDNPEKFSAYFDHEPTRADALASIRKTDLLEQNRRIYDRANKMAFEGYERGKIVKAVRAEYKDISENRATLIARNETARAFGKSQFEADRQFLNAVGKLGQAYKIWYSRRPAGEQDKICPFCRELIEQSNINPVPFDKPFVEYGNSLEVVEDGKVKIFTADYEDIEGGTLHPNCYARDTQVYTNEGWKRVDELTGKELFWSIDPETKKPEWVKAKAKIEGYAETLLRFQDKNFDMAVTKDHNMYVESRHRRRKEKRFYSPQLKEAQTLISTDRFYGGAVWEGKEPKTMKMGDYEVPTELYCKFMGYYLSEGCANYYDYKKEYQGSIGQYKYHDKFWNDLEKMPFRIWNGETDFTFTDKSIVKYCMQFGKSFEKYIPEELKGLSPRLLKIFIDAFVLGDGSKKYSTYSNAWDVMMFTSSTRLRDDLTEVIQKAGYRPTVKLVSPKGTPYKGTNYISNHDVWKISMNNRLHTIKQNTKVEEIEYHDNVYCVELEKNHTLWVMYNGKCWWSGNCSCGYKLVFKNAQGEFVKTLNGGSGSGNFGHSGRPGLVGGSGNGSGLARLTTSEWSEKMNRGELRESVSLLDETNFDYVIVPRLERMDIINEGEGISEENTKKNLDRMTSEEREALVNYTSEYNAGNSSEVNHYLRTGEGNESTKKAAELVSSALDKCSLGEDTVCFRGVEPKVLGPEAEKLGKQIRSAVKNGSSKQFKSMEQRLASLKGMEIQDKGCLSTSKFYDSKYSNLGMTMVIRAKKNDKACDIHSLSRYGQNRDQYSTMFGYSSSTMETEVLFAPNTKLKVKDAKLTDKGILVECETISDKTKNSLSGVELNGGKGSGNFGHAGREGEVGGSAKANYNSGEDLFNAKMNDKLDAFRDLSPEEQAVFCEKAMEMDYKDMPQDLADTDFQRISYALGIKDSPKTVGDKEFEEAIQNGEEEFFRAVKGNGSLTPTQVAERLYTGEYTYQGNGDYCDGTYFTPDWGAMEYYMGKSVDTSDTAVIRCSVSLDANIYYSEPREPFDAKMVSVMNTLEQKTGMKQNTARAVALLGAGYDGWSFVSGGVNKEYLCMLNRKHLTVNRENFLAIKSEYEGGDDVE